MTVYSILFSVNTRKYYIIYRTESDITIIRILKVGPWPHLAQATFLKVGPWPYLAHATLRHWYRYVILYKISYLLKVTNFTKFN